MKYVVLLRGINVGKKQVKMELLKKTFEKLGFTNIKTLLASGNVVFGTDEINQMMLKTKIEQALNDTFGFPIPVILRTFEEIKKLVQQNPFAKIKIDSKTRPYITFLNQPRKGAFKNLGNNQFRILRATDTEVLSVINLQNNFGTVNFMSILEKEFGKNITTRNWNTVQKIAAL